VAFSNQAEFEFRAAEGILVGFSTPEYAKSVNVAAWHLHLLDCQATRLRALFQHLSNLHMAIPETAAFLNADLTRDASHDLLDLYFNSPEKAVVLCDDVKPRVQPLDLTQPLLPMSVR
jgi:alpha-acetolactate decarboxylase